MKYLLIPVITALLAACSKPVPCPATHPLPARPILDSPPVEVDMGIQRLWKKTFSVRTPISRITWAPDSQNFLFISTDKGGVDKLWLYNVKGRRERPVLAGDGCGPLDFAWRNESEILVLCREGLYLTTLDGMDRTLLESGPSIEQIRISPDGTQVAAYAERNLFTLEIDTGQKTILTELDDPNLCAGCVPWLYREEFRTRSGFGWSPDSKKIWFAFVDERPVSTRAVEGTPLDQFTAFPYPRPGEPNPIVDIGVLDVADAEAEPIWMKLDSENDVYIPDATWHPDGTHVLATRLDRLQTTMEVLRCNASSGDCEAIVQEMDPRWVNYTGLPTVLPDGRLFRLSEQSDFMHIHGTGPKNKEGHQEEKQWTRGEWVVQSLDGIDTARERILFTANRAQPTAYSVYSLSMESGDVEPLGTTVGTHKAVWSPDRNYYVDSSSSMNTSPVTHLHGHDGESLGQVIVTAEGNYSVPPDVHNEINPFEANGTTLYAHITRPATIDQTEAYPALIYVYGGPGHQAVTDGFHPTVTPWRNLLAERGIVVITVDNRGSAGRGRQFEAPIHRHLTRAPLADQLATVDYLKALGYVDMKRVGIFGWSFGGTMALTGALETEEVFKLAVAVAPVTDWRYYDTAYTERYMQRPEDNPKGYAATSLLRKADKLAIPLLLIHGLSDNNVHPIHSEMLLDAFIQEGRTPSVLFYPGKGHSITGATHRTHLFSAITSFIEKNL